MKMFISGMMLAGLVLAPMAAISAESGPSISERASKAVGVAEAAYQKGLEQKEVAQKAEDLASAAWEKARTDLKLAEASGDKEKIAAAQAAVLKAKLVAADKARVLARVSSLVERLKIILDKARIAATAVAKAPTPAEALKELQKLEQLAFTSANVLNSIETAMKPHHPIDDIGVTIPCTTTSTTRPTPTQVGQIRG